MAKDIFFSITIPAYKAQFLKECIDSCLAQTYDNFEVIIVNDASPQNLDAIISQYNDPRIKYFKNKVGHGAEHVVGNWDKCLEYAKGDFLICMGDDDKLLPTCLEHYVELINKFPSLDVYHSRTEIIDQNSNIIDIQEARPEFESAYSILFHRLKMLRIQFIGDFLFRTSSLRANGGFYDLPYACCSDDISVILCAAGKGIANTITPGFQYRSNQQTISNTQNFRKAIESYMLACDWYRDFLSHKTDDELDELYRKLLVKFVLPKYRKNKIEIHIQKDLVSNGLGAFLYWLKQYKSKGLTRRDIMKVYTSSMSQKIKNVLKSFK